MLVSAFIFLILSNTILKADGFHAFIVPRQRSFSAKLYVGGTECVGEKTRATASSPLPPLKPISAPPTPIKQRKRRRRDKKSGKKVPIPSRIPKLSEVLSNHTDDSTSDATVQASVKSKSNRLPWRAGYYTSIKTQKRIKGAARRHANCPGRVQAYETLRSFLTSPPDRCNPANLVCALTTSAKVIRPEKLNGMLREQFYSTISVLNEMVDDDLLSPRQICNSAWAIAKFCDRDPSLLPKVLQTSLSSETSVGSAETWDLGRSSENSEEKIDELIDKLAVSLAAKLAKDPFSAKEGELNMAAWAYGIVRHRRRPPGWKLEPQIGLVSSPGTPGQNRNMMKFEKWENEQTGEECTDWSAPTPTETLYDAIADALTARKDNKCRIESCSWSELANVAWSFASHGRSCSGPSEELVVSIARETVRRLHPDSTQKTTVLSRDLAQIIWSLGVLQADNFRLAESLSDVVVGVQEFKKLESSRPLENWSCADLVQVALSLAHSRLDERSLLLAIYDEAVLRLEEQSNRTFQPWELSILIWAQARLNLKSTEGQVFDQFTCAAVHRLSSYIEDGVTLPSIGIKQQEQANIAWSLTVLQHDQSKNAIRLIAAIFNQAASAGMEEGFIQLEHAHQLWQSLFILTDSSPNAVKDVPDWFYEYLRSRWNLEKARTKTSSARHKSISKTLTLMGIAHANEHDEDIDVAIILKNSAAWSHETQGGGTTLQDGFKLAVEFDGPNHFTRQVDKASKQPRALGHTVLKYRLLKLQGWAIVRIPYYEYDKIPHWASMERQRYLQRLLKTHANLKFSSSDASEYKPPVPNRQTRFD